jgi:hypothetical protein
MAKEIFDGFVTKYALSVGIQTFRLARDPACCPNMVTTPLGWHQAFHGEGKEWHRTWESALKRAEEMRTAKLLSLAKSYANMEKLVFTRPEAAP